MTATVLDTKVGEVENKIVNSSSLVTKTFLLLKYVKLRINFLDHAKYITTQDFNKLTAEILKERLKQANLVSKTDFDNKVINFKRKITSNNTKYLEV